MIPLLSITLLFVVPAGRDRKPPQGIQGVWCLVETSDCKRTDPAPEGVRMIVCGDEIILKLAGMTTNRGTFKIGMFKGTSTIDMKLANGQTLLGVFELRGHELIFCVDDASNARPTALKPRGMQWQERWTRKQPLP